ncbi:hypothetical protein ACFO0N_11725 [Halobium salinum]|uniref:Uncharacterized protein n=1 Tax=Halobium salinum TaxID=1364940 RepID=A0ABD5PDP7_9EURY|nr:hypothetical protein [Halobium salinum]
MTDSDEPDGPDPDVPDPIDVPDEEGADAPNGPLYVEYVADSGRHVMLFDRRPTARGFGRP